MAWDLTAPKILDAPPQHNLPLCSSHVYANTVLTPLRLQWGDTREHPEDAGLVARSTLAQSCPHPTPSLEPNARACSPTGPCPAEIFSDTTDPVTHVRANRLGFRLRAQEQNLERELN